ncbi:hypothetical protein M092_0363 [Parabacteroides distasonis str. 3776 D15 iv]|nr:hypothetical protein M090_2306 [Parabacteroides distasonis str. 3776 Po2 i]KDS74178.1 hypothetical protein M092_0363 [Parabacteroides distasonis str. 3776 D15 iv]
MTNTIHIGSFLSICLRLFIKNYSTGYKLTENNRNSETYLA